MSERPSHTAAYEPGRSKDGKFSAGNQLSVGHRSPTAKHFHQLRAMWLDAGALDEMAAVKDELVKMCLTCPQPDVKLKAIVYYLDRTLGKPTENMNLDLTQDGGRPLALPNLTAEEVQIIERVVRRTAGDDPQASEG